MARRTPAWSASTASIRDLLARDGPEGPPIQRAVHFTVQILRGLQAAHAINIIHRDMKPSNCFVIITHDGEEDWVKILDFGISKIMTQGASSSRRRTRRSARRLHVAWSRRARRAMSITARTSIPSASSLRAPLAGPVLRERRVHRDPLQLFTADPPLLREDARSQRSSRSSIPGARARGGRSLLERGGARRGAPLRQP